MAEIPGVNAFNFPPSVPGYWGPAPAGSFVAVTKSDTVPLPPNVRGLWVGGVGAVAVKGVNDNVAAVFTAVPAGTYIPGRFAYVMSTATTATLIVACI